MPTLAQRLRKNPTPAEIRLWRLIGPLRLGGFHFRKQVAIGSYVADFVCHHAKLVIEVDGETHFSDEAIAADKRRDAYLKSRGYTVLRFTNHDVVTNPDGVYVLIMAALNVTPKHGEETPSLPSPQGGG